jgi:hypothetical protein
VGSAVGGLGKGTWLHQPLLADASHKPLQDWWCWIMNLGVMGGFGSQRPYVIQRSDVSTSSVWTLRNSRLTLIQLFSAMWCQRLAAGRLQGEFLSTSAAAVARKGHQCKCTRSTPAGQNLTNIQITVILCPCRSFISMQHCCQIAVNGGHHSL